MNELQIFENEEFELLKEMKNKEFYGYVYVIESEDEVKIGKTTHPYFRIREIISILRKYCGKKTGRVAITVPHTNYSENETILHKLFQEYRLRDSEFFKMSFTDAVNAIAESGIEYKDDSKLMEEELKESTERFKKLFETDFGTKKNKDDFRHDLIRSLDVIENTSAEKKKEIFWDCDVINTAFGRRCIYCTDVKEKDHLERFVFQIIPMDEDEGAGRHLYISIDEGNKKLLTSLEDSSGRTTKYGLGCKISYCPNCGRKL